jgi:retron-type reverse transcriptase
MNGLFHLLLGALLVAGLVASVRREAPPVLDAVFLTGAVAFLLTGLAQTVAAFRRSLPAPPAASAPAPPSPAALREALATAPSRADREKIIEAELAKQGVVKPDEKAFKTLTEWKSDRDRRREERLKREEAARAARHAEYRRRLETQIPFVGRGVSGGLNLTEADAAKLSAAGLPVLADAAGVAAFLGVTVRKLHWLAYHREADRGTHYVYFAVPKKRGGERIICAPKSSMRAAQKRILDGILSKVPAHPAAHGFVPGRGIVSNASPHVGRNIVVNIDLKDFFPSVTYPRVKGMLRSLGFSEQAATLLGLVCTEAPRKRVRFPAPPAAEASPKSEVRSPKSEGEAAAVAKPVYWVAVGDRQLPQGACTSPAITNILCRRLDERLTAFAASIGWTYTRYADDLTFSGSDPAGPHGKAVGKVLAEVRDILRYEGFAVHPDKVRVQRRRGHQSVTGLVVNEKVGVSRAELRRFRAILHNCRRHGLASQNRAGREDFAAHLRGYAEFVRMVDPAKGARLVEEVAALLGKGEAQSA